MAIATNKPGGGLADALKSAMIGQQYIYHHDPFPPTEHTMLYHASVEKVENGFLLKVSHKQGDVPKIYVARDAGELKDLFIAVIVGERISK
jgi:hypothetical protein